MPKRQNTTSHISSGPALSNIQEEIPRKCISGDIKITKPRSIKMSKYAKLSKREQQPSILTPGYRETGDLMTIEDEVKTIGEVNDANEGGVLNPEQICDQRLEVPDDTASENYEDNLVVVHPPSASFINSQTINKLPLPLGLDGAGPTSPFILELFRKGIDINDADERRTL